MAAVASSFADPRRCGAGSGRGPVAEIRRYQAGDLEDLYRICLATGWAGADASGVYEDPKLVGNVYAAPYGVLAPECALVAEDPDGVAGYILGAVDTAAFEVRAEAAWWPALRRRYRDPKDVPAAERSPDQRLARLIHRPSVTPADLVARFPAHLHIDLLPRLQGQGLGRRMMDAWLELAKSMGATGAHLGVGTANQRAVRFYRAYGLQEQAAWSDASVHVFATPL
jgi:ribosomal protein S18 acetylase RimI-like enzyme